MKKSINSIYRKSRFIKLNKIYSIPVVISYIFQWLWFLSRAIAPAVFCSILYNYLESLSYFNNIDEQSISTIVITIFGFQLAFFSIVLSNKNSSILNYKEIEINLFTAFFAQSINFYQVITIFYLAILFLNILIGNSVIQACIIIFTYSLISLLYTYYILRTSKAKLYFKKLVVQYSLFPKNRNYHKG